MAIAATQAQVGRLSMSLTFTSINGTDTISNAELLSCATERGPLYSFLSGSYASLAALMSAWAAAGGILSVAGGAATAVRWTLSGTSAQLTVVDSAASPCAARLALSYTAGR